MKKYLKNPKIILIAILLLAFIMRVYNFRSYYVFSHDQDLASWVIKDILINKHIRLIGQETSNLGVFIGALFYYLQIPFYLIGKMNPLASVFLPIMLGVFATYSMFFVVSKITKKEVGLIAAFIYAVSALIVFTDREVAPTMPVMLWSIWYLYSLFLVYKNKQIKGFILWGFLLGLVWHLNLALFILSPLIVIPLLFFKKRINLKALFLGFVVLIITSSPLIFFEYRHNFSQTRAVYSSLTTKKELVGVASSGLGKLDRVMQLVNKNTIGIFSKSNFVRPSLVTFSLVVLLIYLLKTKKLNSFWVTLFIFWQVLYIGFFTINSINASEYYFNGMNVIWIIIASLGFFEFLKHKNGKKLLFILACLFVLTNLNYIFKYNTDKKGYVEKLNLINEIKSDSVKHNYPCISVSYITSPGYDMGYRYLFYIFDMHVNKPISNSPVYTIVYPIKLVDKIDNRFGSLGLIYPEYDRYNEKDIKLSCQGENSNLTDPMFGYTQ